MGFFLIVQALFQKAQKLT